MSPESRPERIGVALVTGGSKRIGRMIALALAHNGHDVAIHYHSSEREALGVARTIEQMGRRAISLACNLADPAAVRELVPRAAQALGPLTCVVNSASPFEYDSVDDFKPAQLDTAMRVNVSAPILLAQALATQLPAGPSPGVVVNLLDQKLWNPNPDYLSYTLSKAAMKEATTLLAQALAPRVRVVGVAPGITMASGDQSDEDFSKAHATALLGRSSLPLDIAMAVVYLVQAQAVTGTTLLVDGGQHLVGSPRDVMFLHRAASAASAATTHDHKHEHR
jgi:NAD(P)-dependent dehydrogenase (short-subunit alcohol dehydrogenase family)